MQVLKCCKGSAWAAGVVLAALVCFVPGASAQITNSAHDFSGAGDIGGGRICIVCHTPHDGDVAQLSPLWNHTNSTEDYTGRLYTSATLDASDVSNPLGISRLCLSCHDGTVATDAYGGAAGSVFIAAGFQVGGVAPAGLNTEHPISFTYNPALSTTDGELHDPTTQLSGLTPAGTISDDMLFGGSNDQVECASCHDVHNSGGGTPLLVKDNTGSALCLTCHNK